VIAWLAHLIEKHPSFHRVSLSVWRLLPPRLAGFLKGQLARNWLVGAVAVLVDDSTQPPEVLIVEHSYRRKGAWGLPGGALESIDGDPKSPGHDPSPDDVIETALRREVLEELGIEIDVVRLLRVDAIPYVVEEPGPYRLDFYYLCLPVQGFASLRDKLHVGIIEPTSPEIERMRLVALSDLSGYDMFSPDIRFLNHDLPRIEPSLRYDNGL
jgi:8-oxo-dGTP pyrophosphatase MutT (NUDIX family)